MTKTDTTEAVSGHEVVASTSTADEWITVERAIELLECSQHPDAEPMLWYAGHMAADYEEMDSDLPEETVIAQGFLRMLLDMWLPCLASDSARPLDSIMINPAFVTWMIKTPIEDRSSPLGGGVDL